MEGEDVQIETLAPGAGFPRAVCDYCKRSVLSRPDLFRIHRQICGWRYVQKLFKLSRYGRRVARRKKARDRRNALQTASEA